MNRTAKGIIVTTFAFVMAMLVCQRLSGQIVITLPTVDQFNVRTTVMIPDGGQMLLGGVNRGSFGSVERGVPGLSNVPGANRLFKNRGIGQTVGSSNASVTARIIIMDEIESQVMSEANLRAKERIAKNPNLDPKVVRQARFLSRNVGKKRR